MPKFLPTELKQQQLCQNKNVFSFFFPEKKRGKKNKRLAEELCQGWLHILLQKLIRTRPDLEGLLDRVEDRVG